MPMISVVIPTLNEEKTIGKVIDSIPRDFLKKMGYDVDVLVVDGNSSDRTVKIALKKRARVVIVKKRGYGLAYLIGFKYARGDIIVTLDADMTYPPSEIPKLIKMLERHNIDFITTNRFLRFDRLAFNKTRLLGNRLLTFLVFVLFGKRIKDTQSGMWCFKKEVLKKLRLSSFGMEFSTEIKLEASRKLKFLEVPIYYRRRGGGRSKIRVFRDFIRIVMFIIKYRILSFIGNTSIKCRL